MVIVERNLMTGWMQYVEIDYTQSVVVGLYGNNTLKFVLQVRPGVASG